MKILDEREMQKQQKNKTNKDRMEQGKQKLWRKGEN